MGLTTTWHLIYSDNTVGDGLNMGDEVAVHMNGPKGLVTVLRARGNMPCDHVGCSHVTPRHGLVKQISFTHGLVRGTVLSFCLNHGPFDIVVQP